MKSPARLVRVSVNDASAKVLNWLASAIKKNAYSQTGNHRPISGVKNYCNDWRLAGSLLSDANIGVVSQVKGSDTKCVSFTDDSGARFYFYAATLPMAIVQCFVAMQLGKEANVPEVLL